MSTYKIAVIGDRESVIGFKALGLEVYAVTQQELRRVFTRITDAVGKYAIIYITEEYASLLAAEIAALKDELIPAVIPIPSKNGSTGLGMAALSSTVERAVGADIL